MPRERLSMRKIRDVLQLNALGRTYREIAQSLGLGRTTVGDYVSRAAAAGLGWPLPDGLDDQALEEKLFVRKEDRRAERPQPDWSVVHLELKSNKHVTLALLWQEYKAAQPDGYQYTQFCEHYRRWAGKLQVWMRQEHKAGEKLFVDFSGDGVPYFNRFNGEPHIAQLFVGALGASSFTFAEATRSQELEEWIRCHVHAYEFFGGATQLLIPDQTRTAVTKSCRYEPLLNRTYQDLARHYSTCIVPARPRKPRDKAKVEAAVLLAQRWIIASLRHRSFYSIGEINAAIRERLEILNARPMRRLRRSRRELFEAIDFPKLIPLPKKPFEYAEWKIGVTVNLDYHIEFERNFYSVPYQLAHEPVDVRASATMVEIFHEGRRVASHPRARGEIQHVTVPEHMSSAHRAHAQWTPSRLVQWARKTGPATALLVETILKDRPHPEQGYRTCLGIIRLEKRYSPERLEKASQRALACGGRSYRSVEAILRNRLEDQPLPPKPTRSLPLHENVRGASYYYTSKEYES